ncbi:DUF2778 domain-containing protein [Rhizobium sp. KVB221]|uniref:DUF2778 domain-containing protein n=1 Tax=Rhizobium setariae TaxID=2801340 RepID=A0A936YTG6_9HYPH|nr:DUF2778 domain-containing protein [Rhizobium setariae]MBL0374591.1 DUF2778 domain-containing protein [Rhizobium setariae]
MSENMSLATPLHLKVVVADDHRRERRLKVAKFSRLSKPSESEIRRKQLTVAAIRMAYHRSVAAQLAFAEENKKAEKAKIVAAFALAKSSVEQEEKISGKPTLVTALVEDVPAHDLQPFGLVLAKPETEEDVALPRQIPLPEARPLIETVVIEQKPADEKPVARRNLDNKDDKEDVAYAKPERSLFGDLFKSKASDTAWPAKVTKVAIYDVSNATVYLPDGTKLRAHSGIGGMRDNPRYEHVTMRGPTPAGIYRLSMREKRFYGVEAIRMTSIDGRDPKNRTGLLTHTNLLRGQKGSHGCVAFQNYQPFLRAFKRGQITMLVVVPELPSSRTQLAALYRKAGA